MIRLAITPAAFEAIAKTMPFGSVSYEEATDGQGFVWVAPNVVDRLRLLRRPGEDYSQVILKAA